MMARMLILHGEHELNSRARLIELTSAAKQNGTQVIWLDGKKLTTADLELALGSDTLFANPKLLVIEQVFAGPKSKRKDDLAKALGFFLQRNAGRPLVQGDFFQPDRLGWRIRWRRSWILRSRSSRG